MDRFQSVNFAVALRNLNVEMYTFTAVTQFHNEAKSIINL